MRRRIDGAEVGKERAHRRRISFEPNGRVEHHAEAPLGADERSEEVVPIGLSLGIAKGDDLSTGEEHGEREDMIERHTVFEAVWAAGILGHVATNRTCALARRVGSVVQTICGRRRSQRRIDHAGLDDRACIVTVDRDNPLEPVQPEQHDIVSQRAARQACARSARHECCTRSRERSHNGDRLVPRAGKYGERRLALIAGQPIRFIGAQLGWPEEHTLCTDHGRQLRRETGIQGHTT